MLSQYISTVETRLAASHISSMESRRPRPTAMLLRAHEWTGGTPVAPPSTTNRLSFGRFRHQRHQVMRHPAGRMPRYLPLFQIVSLDRAHAKPLDCCQIHYDLRSSLQSVVGLHLG